jgi:hypothetical protein
METEIINIAEITDIITPLKDAVLKTLETL